MSKEFLDMSFYHDKNGKYNELASTGIDCIRRNIWFSLKCKHPNLDPFKTMISDINYVIVESDKYIVEKIYLTNHYRQFRIKTLTPKSNEGALLLRSLLDEGNPVIVSTRWECVPFYIGYNPERRINEPAPSDSHVVLLLHYDDEYYYFIEQIGNMKDEFKKENMNNYNYSYICKVKRKEFDPFINYYANYYIVNLSEDIDSEQFITSCFFMSHNNYYKGSEKKEDGVYYWGRKAILKLLEICKMNNRNSYGNKIITDFFLNPYSIWLRNIISSRIILSKCLERRAKENNKLFDEAIDALDKNINSYNILKNSLIKIYMKDNSCSNLFNIEFRKHVCNVLTTEDTFIDCLTQLSRANSWDTGDTDHLTSTVGE